MIHPLALLFSLRRSQPPTASNLDQTIHHSSRLILAIRLACQLMAHQAMCHLFDFQLFGFLVYVLKFATVLTLTVFDVLVQHNLMSLEEECQHVRDAMVVSIPPLEMALELGAVLDFAILVDFAVLVDSAVLADFVVLVDSAALVDSMELVALAEDSIVCTDIPAHIAICTAVVGCIDNFEAAG